MQSAPGVSSRLDFLELRDLALRCFAGARLRQRVESSHFCLASSGGEGGVNEAGDC